MKVFDLTRPDGWKWPAISFALVTGLLFAANAIPYQIRRTSLGGPGRRRGWPSWYWSHNAAGFTHWRPEEAAWNVAVAATLALWAALIVRWNLCLRAAAEGAPRR